MSTAKRLLVLLMGIICTNCVASSTLKTFLYEDPNSGVTRTCELCPPGSRLFAPCELAVNDTVCMQCNTGTFTSGWNHFDHCRPLKKCPPGAGAKRLGSIKSNTKCEKCPPGRFSDVSSFYHPCFLHTPCLEIGMSLAFEGNSTHDSLCSFPTEKPKDSIVTASNPDEDSLDKEGMESSSTPSTSLSSETPDLLSTKAINWTINSSTSGETPPTAKDPITITSHHVSTTAKDTNKVRDDGRCGKDWPSPDGHHIGECDPYSPDPCCSPFGNCGGDEDHCDCDLCIDFRILEKGNIDDSSLLEKGGYPAITLAISTVVIMTIIAIVWHKKQKARKIKEKEMQKFAKRMSRKHKNVEEE